MSLLETEADKAPRLLSSRSFSVLQAQAFSVYATVFGKSLGSQSSVDEWYSYKPYFLHDSDLGLVTFAPSSYSNGTTTNVIRNSN